MSIFRQAGQPRLIEQWVAPFLNKRVQILKPIQTEATLGGFIQDYEVLKTIWGGIKPFSESARVRFSVIDDLSTVSHQFAFRYLALQGIDGSSAIYPLTSNHYLGLEQGSGIVRLFRAVRLLDVDEKHEILRVLAEEVEEQGTGYSGASY